MKKCCFVIPYFGKFPNFFPVFLKTCERNPDFNWLIISDSQYDSNLLPENVKIIYMEFHNVKSLIKSKFDFKISLDRPYKLCDYKPAFGYIFEKYISNFMFWGYCDLDVLFGKLSDFITDEDLEKFDKLFCLGHFTMIRNTYENNRLFMKPVQGEYWFKESFESKEITVFDETFYNYKNINNIFKFYKKNFLKMDYSLNISKLPTKFIKTTFDSKKNEFIKNDEEGKFICLWENGKLYRVLKENSAILKKEFMYVHFQERKMHYKKEILKQPELLIVPNLIKSMNYSKISPENFKKISKSSLNFHSFRQHLKTMKNRFINFKKNRIKKIE